MARPAPDAPVTPEAYLALEAAAEFKSEYAGGEVFAMAGGSPAHSQLAFNLGTLLGPALRASPCRGYNADLRIRVPETDLYTYPDLTIVCGEPEFDPRDPHTIVNPTLIVEVLSPSTEAWDRGGKFAHYRRLPSLQEYLLVCQDRPHIDQFVRQGEQWVLTEVSGPEGILRLHRLEESLPLAEIYDRVELPERPGR